MTEKPSDKVDLMIEKQICERVIARVLAGGVDYAEIYAEDKRSDTVSVISGNVENALTARNIGAGIRAIKGTNSVYAYGNDISEAGLTALADKVCDAVGGIGKSGQGVYRQHHGQPDEPDLLSPVHLRLRLAGCGGGHRREKHR